MFPPSKAGLRSGLKGRLKAGLKELPWLVFADTGGPREEKTFIDIHIPPVKA